MNNWFEESVVWKKLKNSRTFYLLLISIFVLISFKILFPEEREPTVSNGSRLVQLPTAEAAPSEWREYEEELEKDLAIFLSQIKGCGKVTVMLSLDQSEERQRAIDIDENIATTEETDSAGGERVSQERRETQTTVQEQVNGEQRTVWLSKKAPIIRGVVVIAEGAADATIKTNLARAVQTYFDIPMYRVCILSK